MTTPPVTKTEKSNKTPQGIFQTTTPALTTNESSSKIQDLGVVLEERKKTVNNSKEKLVEIINENVTDIIENKETSEQETNTTQIHTLRDELIKNVDSSLSTPATKEQLIKEINKSVVNIIENKETSEQETNTVKILNLHDELIKNVDSSLSTPATKEQLIKEINKSVIDIIKDDEKSKQKTDIEKIHVIRDELIKNVDSSLSASTTITPKDINNLKTEINKGIEDIGSTVAPSTIISKMKDTSLRDVATTLDLLSEAVSNQTESLRKQEADLLYKDSNQDGISDYDSMYVYNMDPALPSPVSTHENKIINAGEKVLLGFDPVQSEITKVNKEQPLKSEAPVILTYKVKEVALTEKKEIVFKGQALPNSFITLYIYSTPIVVTVKTDSKGEWQYVLDKELENGDHTIYTATVNNSGNIIAKSSPYLFTKTAEAATLKDFPFTESSMDTNKPGLLEDNNIYLIIIFILAIVIMTLILIGITNKKSKENM